MIKLILSIKLMQVDNIRERDACCKFNTIFTVNKVTVIYAWKCAQRQYIQE